MNRMLVLAVAGIVAAGAGQAGAAGPGDIAWVAAYGGDASGPDSAMAIAVDASGNVVVTGSSEGQGTGMDIATVKYAPDGTQLWAARFNDTLASDDEAADVVVDRLGNVIVTGYGGTSQSDQDYTTIKYNAAGVQQWVARYNSPDNSGDFATAVAVDDSGNVFVTGWCLNLLAINADYTTIKYSPSGLLLWAKRYNGPGSGTDSARALAVDAQGNVYVTGQSTGVDSGTDYRTIKYSASGDRLWMRRYNGPGNSYDEAQALAVDAEGNVYVAGCSAGDGSSSDDYATIKYSQE